MGHRVAPSHGCWWDKAGTDTLGSDDSIVGRLDEKISYLHLRLQARQGRWFPRQLSIGQNLPGHEVQGSKDLAAPAACLTGLHDFEGRGISGDEGLS